MKIVSRIVGAVAVCVLGAVLSSCAGKKNEEKAVVRMATKTQVEQLILGEMTKLLVEANSGLTVEVTHAVGGGTTNIQPAMEKGEFDFYAEYTGTGWNMVLKKGVKYDESLFEQMQAEYDEKYGFEWLEKIGFNNTYGIAVRKETAEKYNLKTYSDLAAASNELLFGANYDWFERIDGYNAVKEAYGFNFKGTVDLDINLRYEALTGRQIDALSVFTTDGELGNPDLVVLEDDKSFYQSYMCSFVVRKDTLAKYPELKDALLLLSGKIDDATMARLNKAVQIDGRDETEVAAEFLKEINLVR